MTSAESALWCVVPAAGCGARVGGEVPKQYLPIAGKPLLMHTLERLAAHPRIAGLMVVLAAQDTHWPKLDEIAGKPVRTTTGGATRAASVLAGLQALQATVAVEDFVLVHDAARPCVRDQDLSRLIVQGTAAGGALLAAPLRDTLKLSNESHRVLDTEPRQARWRALTPQLFRYAELVAALESARDVGISATDESMAMERAGHGPLLVEGAEDNIKVTTQADFALADFILSRMQ